MVRNGGQAGGLVSRRLVNTGRTSVLLPNVENRSSEPILVGLEAQI